MPNPTFNSNSLTTTLLLLFVLLLGLFPGLFHYLWATPLYLCPIALSSPSQPSKPTIPVVLEKHSLNTMSWFQKTITLPSKSRGCYLVTNDIVSALPELKQYKIGTVNLFLQHTSAALSLNENYDSDVRTDMSTALDRIVEEDKKNKGLYKHDAEGSDDMPGHIKSALIGASITIPIRDGKLATGMWQGIWYMEFRDAKHTRKVVATINGEKA